MTDQVNTVSRPWRRFLRFSMRGLVVLVLVIGAGLGWLVRSAHIQRDAVAAITRAGGSVKYDWGWTNGDYLPGVKPSKPRWLVNLIGVDYFGHVTEVWLFSSSTPTDETFVRVGRLTRVRRLNLYRSPINDARLAHLTGLTELSLLNLGETKISDAGLAHLAGFVNLSTLDLGGTQVSDGGLAHLKDLTKISLLGLGHTQVTDAGLAHLKRLTSLSALGLFATRVTDAGIEELKRSLPSLKITH